MIDAKGVRNMLLKRAFVNRSFSEHTVESNVEGGIHVRGNGT